MCQHDMIDVWTTADVTTIEDGLHRELGGKLHESADGDRGLIFGDVPGVVRVFRPRYDYGGKPDIALLIEARDWDRSIETQHAVAQQVFEALGRVIPDRFQLVAEDDTVVAVRPAVKAAS